MSADAESHELSALWRRHWPACRPVAHELRTSAADHWVRFHSLPESKRYAETPDEYAEVLRRHHCVLADLQAAVVRPPGSELWAITVSWSESAEPAPRQEALAAAVPVAEHWWTLPYDVDPGSSTQIHLWASRVAASTSLAALFLLCARDETREVIIADLGLEWLYHPYDGGADVIAPTVAVRDALRVEHRDWLSRLPSGM